MDENVRRTCYGETFKMEFAYVQEQRASKFYREKVDLDLTNEPILIHSYDNYSDHLQGLLQRRLAIPAFCHLLGIVSIPFPR